MDVRCEKCQTEYELDEARLKPGGVTVKCTNCGHMFKIRKRAITNVGAATPAQRAPTSPAGLPHDPPASADDLPTTVERQWLIRLENGDQKSCRELATLQQWIVAGVVTRESLISRTGKTWKRLGDISELAQYFDIADEARTTRDERRAAPTPQPTATAGKPPIEHRGTMLGVGHGPAAKAAGGTILPDDDDETRRSPPRQPTAPPPLPPKIPLGAKTPPMGSIAAPAAGPSTAPPRRAITTPPPPPPKKPDSPARATPPPTALDGRGTGAWANEPVRTDQGAGTSDGASGPFVGKLSAIPDEPAFAAGRVRVGEEAGFETGKVRMFDDDDDDLLPRRRGARGGLLIVVMVLLVGGAAAAGIYALVIKKQESGPTAKPPADAAVVVIDAKATVTPVIDAAEPPPVSPLEAARGELLADNEVQLRKAFDSIAALPDRDEPAAQAVRANLGAALAQALLDRAGLVTDKAEADRLRKDAKALALETATSAQRALKAVPDDPAANLAMASVLRLQGKPAREIGRYVDAARPKAGTRWSRDLALHEALVLARDGKLDDAKAGFAAIDQGDGKLETSNDVRARFHLALVALAQNKPADARPLVEQVLTAQPEHAGARALLAKLETAVAKTDPIPPEDPTSGGSTPGSPRDTSGPRSPRDPTSGGSTPGSPRDTGPRSPRDPTSGGSTPGSPRDTSGPRSPSRPNPEPPVAAGSYDSLLARANQLADTSCTRALELYGKALEQKPNGVEALSGMGYCHIDAKQFASAFSKFRAALAVSSRYEPALWGVAEAYQQQGRKEQAIEAYRAYLEVYPGSAKALKQLERLGASDSGASNGGGVTSPAGVGSSAGSGTTAPAPDASGG